MDEKITCKVSVLCATYNHEEFLRQTLDGFVGQKTNFPYEVLVNGADVAAMNVRFAPSVTKEYNAELCALLGVKIPDDYIAIQ